MNEALVNRSSKTRSLLAWVLVRPVVEHVMISWSLGRGLNPRPYGADMCLSAYEADALWCENIYQAEPPRRKSGVGIAFGLKLLPQLSNNWTIH